MTEQACYGKRNLCRIKGHLGKIEKVANTDERRQKRVKY